MGPDPADTFFSGPRGSDTMHETQADDETLTPPVSPGGWVELPNPFTETGDI